MPQSESNRDSENRILRASLETLQILGAAGFSTPEVARKAKLRQSHITYYFPTRKELLLATTNFALQRYEREFESRLAGIEKFNAQKSEEFLHWLFTDAIENETVTTFPELWSLANADKDIALNVQKLYLNAAHAVVRALGLNPTEKKNGALLELLLVIGSISEGITAVHGHRRKSDPIFVKHRDLAISIFAPLLLKEYKAATKRSR